MGNLSKDINGGGLIDLSDMMIIDNNNLFFVGSILPF
jgi:hypothetical protein